MKVQTLPVPVRRPTFSRLASRGIPDPWTLGVLVVMALLTISTPSVEVGGIPRITLISALFTIYMLLRIRGRLNPDLVCFVLAYVLGFLPSATTALLAGEVRASSFFQGVLGLITFMVVGTYFYNWLSFTPQPKVMSAFKRLVISLITLSIIELLLFKYFIDIRLLLYRSESLLTDINALLNREIALYGGRPSALFSEPSHFARYVGLMMVAYLAATRRSVPALWAAGAFLLLTRSVSFFFAAPAMFIELRRAITERTDRTGRSKRSSVWVRLVGVGIVVGLALGGLAFTQSERISAALGGRSNTSAAVTGDNSLNERIVIPAGYFFDGPRSLVIGLGPTPQDEMQEYTVFATRAAYRSRLNAEYKSAVSATIFTLAGMGYVGVAVMLLVIFQLRGWFGVAMVLAYFVANIFSSGYNSSTALVPSGLLLGIMSFQRLQHLAMLQAQRRTRMRMRVEETRPIYPGPKSILAQSGR